MTAEIAMMNFSWLIVFPLALLAGLLVLMGRRF